jgi:hypothetical protein
MGNPALRSCPVHNFLPPASPVKLGPGAEGQRSVRLQMRGALSVMRAKVAG